MMDARPVAPAPSLLLRGSLTGLALLATTVAGYLTWAAWSQRGLPLGCGELGGCAEVLTSRWSTLAGVPIGAIALPVYLAVLWSALRPSRPVTQWLLSFAATALVAAAAWFLWIQALVLRAYCPWCLCEHALGLAMAALAFLTLRRRGRARQVRGTRKAALVGLLSVAGVAAIQTVQPSKSTIVRRPGGEAVGASGGSAVSLLQGHLLVTGDDPRIGAATAPHRLYLMFDYCCPHCRRTHEYLLEALARYPEQLSVICLPAPRDADCNAAIAETEARFEHACELAELALAVWRARPEAFAEFDRWLFAPSQPPSPNEARRRAAELVTDEAIDEQLAGGAPRRHLARNVQAFNDSQLEYLPVIAAPGMDTIVGRPESREALLSILDDELLGGGANHSRGVNP